MKKLILTALLLMPISALANDVIKNCTVIADSAKNTMILRQRNTPASDLMIRAKGEQWLEAMIIEAYSKPVMSLQENKDEMADEFYNRWFMLCYERSK